MGGAATEIDATTKNIIIESATFNLYNLRATQMRHGIFSEAITRFTKGQPAALTAPVLAEAVRMMEEMTGAKAVSAVAEAYPGQKDAPTVVVPVDVVNATLGSKFTVNDIDETLQNVEFIVESDAMTSTVTAPYWRQDIHITEDIIEEIGRLNGFDTIEPRLPHRDFTAVMPDAFDRFRSQLRDLLTRAGANEALTYSFVHGDLMKKVGQNPDNAYRVTNSISPDLQYYRQSIVPSLLSHIHANVRAGYDHFALYEMNKFHTKVAGLTDENVPKELDSLGLVVTNAKGSGAAYYEAKRLLDFVAKELHLDLAYEPLEEDSDYPVTQPFEPKRSARVWDRATRERIGVVGELKRTVTKGLKLPDYTAGFEVSPRALLKLVDDSHYQPSSKFPSTERDICFQVPTTINYDALYQAVVSAGTAVTVTPLDIYQAEGSDTKNITLRLTFVSNDRTLTGEEIATLVTAIETTANQSVHAKVI
jgi:phenylalanyl-tRNA synthetase beta chain